MVTFIWLAVVKPGFYKCCLPAAGPGWALVREQEVSVSDQDCLCSVSQRRLRARAKKAIEEMQLRTLKEGDKVGLPLSPPCTTAQPLPGAQALP